ncbi:hypothetical protein KI387_025830 [Taxus chinensis]|uniref:Amidase domain-containing protein n=1 Tax=Taxus chinensis TaxID=29808 RepID=A0AA38FVD0_TAXCH|nr:hypothetical protein KI387_025830 [Taxus chinensis]
MEEKGSMQIKRRGWRFTKRTRHSDGGRQCKMRASSAELAELVNPDALLLAQNADMERLKSGGFMGKASLSEWASSMSFTAPEGWSSRGGQPKNSYVLTADPCGSSTGSAVGVSANMAAVSLATGTDGSILCPSSSNSVVGIRPTVGLTSRAGVIPISHNQDTVG